MALFDAVSLSLSAPKSSVLVATFDHRTGNHASRAARMVERKSRQSGFRCIVGTAETPGKRESEWRDERWRFLRSVARKFKAPVLTAHTLDDQIETVFMNSSRCRPAGTCRAVRRVGCRTAVSGASPRRSRALRRSTEHSVHRRSDQQLESVSAQQGPARPSSSADESPAAVSGEPPEHCTARGNLARGNGRDCVANRCHGRFRRVNPRCKGRPGRV